MKRLASAGPSPAPGQHSDPGFSRAVVDWQRQHGRHSLPWQRSTDAYRIWLSEIMLQQTQVAAVIPYYQRFLERFPTVVQLADADIAEVMALWSGLGYYSRARNLHRCAQLVRDEHGGAFPADATLLATLPGIGRSTAAAIAAFAWGERAAILDGNVKRVFCRVFGVEGFPGEKRVENALWERAQALLPEADAQAMQAYTQGLMDLGATVCTRSRPACPSCPLAQRCVARETGRVAELPQRKPRKPVPVRHADMLVLVCEGRVLLQQRGPSGIWGGLLSLPELALDVRDGPQAAQQVAQFAAGFGPVRDTGVLPERSHGFTHFTLHFRPWLVRLDEVSPAVAEAAPYAWLPLASVAGAALPAPVKKLLLGLFGANDLLAAA
jgi:A/G-specific adenine glycosylase